MGIPAVALGRWPVGRRSVLWETLPTKAGSYGACGRGCGAFPEKAVAKGSDPFDGMVYGYAPAGAALHRPEERRRRQTHRYERCPPAATDAAKQSNDAERIKLYDKR